MALYGSLVWPYGAPHGLIAFNGHGPGVLSHLMVFYGRISSFLAVIDPNSIGLVYSMMIT